MNYNHCMVTLDTVIDEFGISSVIDLLYFLVYYYRHSDLDMSFSSNYDDLLADLDDGASVLLSSVMAWHALEERVSNG